MINEKKLQEAFANWPVTNRFWQTGDGECFFTESKAIKHTQNIEDKSIKLCRRADIEIGKPAAKPKITKKTKS
jgi:hypothetical protein